MLDKVVYKHCLRRKYEIFADRFFWNFFKLVFKLTFFDNSDFSVFNFLMHLIIVSQIILDCANSGTKIELFA